MRTIEPQINEGDTFPLTITFASVDWTDSAPTSVTYRVDCVTNGQQIRDWTSVTAAASVTITLSSSDNAIIDNGNSREKKMLVVKGTDDSNQRIETFTYWVNNIAGV